MRIHELGDARRPIGVSLGTIGSTVDWWLESARRLEDAGYAGVWAWDHQGARAARPRRVIEAWTTVTAATMVTGRVAIGTHVLNVMNRHPAILARMAATLQALARGRLVLGIGIGGNLDDHAPLGIALPPVEERVERLRAAVAVLRALWTGEPATLDQPFYPLHGALLRPAPEPPPPILLAGQSSRGARLAAELGDGWTTRPDLLAGLLPVFLDGLAEAGRSRAEVSIMVGWEGGRTGVDALAGSPWIAAPDETLAAWRGAGADGIILTARTTADVDALVDAAGRW